MEKPLSHNSPIHSIVYWKICSIFNSCLGSRAFSIQCSKGIEDVRLIDYKWLESFNVISLQKRLLVGKSKEKNVFIYLRLYDEKRYDRGCRNCLFMSHPGGLWDAMKTYMLHTQNSHHWNSSFSLLAHHHPNSLAFIWNVLRLSFLPPFFCFSCSFSQHIRVHKQWKRADFT